ncbi:hypothetical protein GCM10010102_43960 [Promicromonospora citrea]|uniref:Uncharacterized protein n=2 Tax=Promicromonospora citrea TaxID=43677 RepID=A0A8H9L776_9MICO|nr:hypothetical protein GCM10010102_43960 [Promicromonospora citrea]
MVTDMRIDSDALGRLLHWPEHTWQSLPPALWLPADPDDEPRLLASLGAAWGSFGWYGLGSWFAPVSAPEGPAGLADRYDGLARELIAEASLTTPRGLRVRSEWGALDPGSGRLHDFVSAARNARGSGSALAVLAHDASARTWYAASTAILHRGLLALGGLAGDDRGLADRNASLSYLAAADAAGFAAVLPLDNHPWGGLVVAGGEDLLTVLTGLLPDDLPGIADVTPQDVVSRAGGIAV